MVSPPCFLVGARGQAKAKRKKSAAATERGETPQSNLRPPMSDVNKTDFRRSERAKEEKFSLAHHLRF